MHKLTSSRSVIALRLGSLTLILSALLFAATVGVIGYGFYTNDPGTTLKGLYGVILSLGVFITAWDAECRGTASQGAGKIAQGAVAAQEPPREGPLGVHTGPGARLDP